MSDSKLTLSVCHYICGKYIDSVIEGHRSDLDLHLILAMCASYRQNFDLILGNAQNEHQDLSNQVFKYILEQVEKDKKIPILGGLEDKLIQLMAKAFKRELEKLNVNNDYSLHF